VAKVFNGPDVFPIIQPTTSNHQSPITSITEEFMMISLLLYLVIAAVNVNVSFGDVRWWSWQVRRCSSSPSQRAHWCSSRAWSPAPAPVTATNQQCTIIQPSGVVLKKLNLTQQKQTTLECGPMPNVMVALPNIGGALCSTPQSLADAHYLTDVQ